MLQFGDFHLAFGIKIIVAGLDCSAIRKSHAGDVI